MRDELAEKIKALEAFGVLTRSTTHDLNNQMAAIMTVADLVLEALPVGHPIRDDVEAIRVAGERAIARTRELSLHARRLAPVGKKVA